MKQAIILCSGGLDSVVTAYYAKKKLDYEKIIILFFDYGQRNVEAERKRSKRCAEDLNAGFHEINLEELSMLSTSLLNTNNKTKKISRKDLKDSKGMDCDTNSIRYYNIDWLLAKETRS